MLYISLHIDAYFLNYFLIKFLIFIDIKWKHIILLHKSKGIYILFHSFLQDAEPVSVLNVEGAICREAENRSSKKAGFKLLLSVYIY